MAAENYTGHLFWQQGTIHNIKMLYKDMQHQQPFDFITAYETLYKGSTKQYTIHKITWMMAAIKMSSTSNGDQFP